MPVVGKSLKLYMGVYVQHCAYVWLLCICMVVDAVVGVVVGSVVDTAAVAVLRRRWRRCYAAALRTKNCVVWSAY